MPYKTYEELSKELTDEQISMLVAIDVFTNPAAILSLMPNNASTILPAASEIAAPPKRAEQALLLILAKEERDCLIGDLAEEYSEIQSIHGERFAKLWYWKQVAASAWPLIWKALRWGIWISMGAWVRRIL